MRKVFRAHPRLVGAAWFVFVLIFVSIMFTASFFLTAYIYKLANLHPGPWAIQIINSLLGLLFTGLMIGSVSKVARSMGWVPERNLFKPILEALEKIATGDFSIRLENDFEDNQIVGELATRFNKMAVELNQMENLRQEFISNVSHEIQSPLTSIHGFAQALQNDRLSIDERRHYLNIIENESSRLSRITENLLQLATLESDQAKFDPRPYRLDKQIRSLILVYEPQWAAKSIAMEASLDEVSVTADEDLLSQVWINLIQNSIKFTPQEGKICIDLHASPENIEFKIRDTGIGLSEEDQERVFERFYKADKSRTRSAGGSGLGLSIAQKIVAMHRGNITVESQLNQGATFIVCLPVEQ